ncbi:cytochrome b/b6 domain-containing protein [Sphingobium aromaticiconvertens]|uniref:cytochrome b/b6 domain-containing protein n=1 Tax=Sphingobium aromaticiconvertens TaxID=365341 RepID=UPI0030165D98
MTTRYSRTAMTLHWLIAIALAFQIGVGWGLEHLSAKGFALYQLHKSVGITILLLTLLRIAVRYWKPRPAPAEDGVTGALAKAVHAGLYLFMLGGPLTGWALVSTAKVKVPTLLFGVVPLPHLPLPQAGHPLFEGAHGLLAWIAIALLLLHVAGAVRHQWLIGDGLIWRMVPGRSTLVILALMASVPVAFLIGQAAVRSASAPAAASAMPEAGEGATVNAVASSESETATPETATNAATTDNAVATVANIAEEATPAPPSAWTVQSGGRLTFSVGNAGYTVDGGFSRWTATIVMDPERPETADIRVEIDVASASVSDPTQTEMLANDEFFAVAAHPRATFIAKGAKRSGKGYTARGTLMLKGVSRPQSIRFTLTGSGATRQVEGSASIARTSFNIGTGESGSGLDPSVTVRFTFAATGKAPK